MGLSCADNGNPPSTTSPAPPGPALDPEQALTGLLSDLTFYQVPYDSGWHTAVALTVRNQDTGPIEIKAAQFGDLENLVLGEPRIVGPQSPSLTLQILPGDPPRALQLPVSRFPDSRLKTYLAIGFLLRSMTRRRRRSRLRKPSWSQMRRMTHRSLCQYA